jgi:hypothetical protein
MLAIAVICNQLLQSFKKNKLESLGDRLEKAT